MQNYEYCMWTMLCKYIIWFNETKNMNHVSLVFFIILKNHKFSQIFFCQISVHYFQSQWLKLMRTIAQRKHDVKYENMMIDVWCDKIEMYYFETFRFVMTLILHLFYFESKISINWVKWIRKVAVLTFALIEKLKSIASWWNKNLIRSWNAFINHFFFIFFTTQLIF